MNVNRADSYQAGRADGERWAKDDLRDYDISRGADIREKTLTALFFSDLGIAYDAEAAYWLGVLRGYRSLTR